MITGFMIAKQYQYADMSEVNQRIHFYNPQQPKPELERLRSTVYETDEAARQAALEAKEMSYHDWVIVRIQERDDVPHAGDAVRMRKTDAVDGWWASTKDGSIAIIGGMIGQDMSVETASITFNASAYRDDRYLSCSGGPGTIGGILTSSLTRTNEVYRHNFWCFENDHAQAHHGRNFWIEVPVWEWDGSRRW